MTVHREPKHDVANRYVDYLDKEMTIMGILSTFCILVIGGCVNALSNVSKEQSQWFKGFWHEQGPFIFFGLCAVLLSAFFFYRQRSLLSYYVGQIHLSSDYSDLADGSVSELHDSANNWRTWRFYRMAFICLFAAAAFFGRVASTNVLSSGTWLLSVLECLRFWELYVPTALCLILCVSVCMAFDAFPNDDHPYKRSWQNPKKFLRAATFFWRGGLE